MQSRHRQTPRRKARATTADLLAKDTGKEKIRPKWRKHYNRLKELSTHLAARRMNHARDALDEHPDFSSHMADAGTDTYNRDFALGLLSTEQNAVYEIAEALDRIRNGSYGICELTGEPIPEARLEAIPWTRFAVEAERQLERDGAVSRAKLGPRESVERTNSQEENEES